VTSRKQHFKRLYSVNGWINDIVFIYQIFQTKWRKKSLKINMNFDSAHFHIYISYSFLKHMKHTWLFSTIFHR
jgi:hypothetical protein